jgi:hypothetical protein
VQAGPAAESGCHPDAGSRTIGDNLHVVHVANDPSVSGRLRSFLEAAVRRPTVPEHHIHASAALQVDGRRSPAPDDVVRAMVDFERRYGGLGYPMIVGTLSEYGLDEDVTAYPTPDGTAFAGIWDGDWNWAVDVLPDGRTAMAPGVWPARVIDRTVNQRLEKHALLAAVRHWPHRAYECFTPTGVPPWVRAEVLPPLVPEASGPADRWWFDDVTAVQLTLHGWPPRHDHWIVRVFTRAGYLLAGEDAVVRSAVHGGSAKPAGWCELCRRGLPGDKACQPLP